MRIGDCSIKFGTSGARALVEDFTDGACSAMTLAFIGVMRRERPVARVAIGIDLRPSSPRMAAACIAAARSQGVEVDYYGVLPTPALALQAMADAVPAIMITGSHIPFDRNGIKFYRPEGEITKADEHAILDFDVEFTPPEDIEPLPQKKEEAAERYLGRYTHWFGSSALKGMRVGLYQHSAAGRDISREVLEALGAEVIALGRSDDFVPVDTEAVSEEDKQKGSDWARQYNLDALLTTDGDGDRPLLADERGGWWRGDILGLLCAREVGIDAIAMPISCNTAIEKSGAFDHVERTRIGSPHVLAAMSKLEDTYTSVAGFEANGGFLLGTAVEKSISGQSLRLAPLPTRDALLPALTVMASAALASRPLSSLLNDLPRRFTASDRLQNFPTDRSRALISEWRDSSEKLIDDIALEKEVVDQDFADGLRVTLDNGDIIHLRPSGNAPELRCYAESCDEDSVQELVAHVLSRIAIFCGAT